MARIGYARVSTGEQDPAPQRDALAAAGCAPVFEDRASGARADRPGLAQALAYVRAGDVLVVWKLDRLGRSLPHLIEVVRGLEGRGVGLTSLIEGIDTTTPGGRLVFHVFGALGQFERDLVRERTRTGLKAAEARGQRDGRRPVVTDEKLRRARLARQGADGPRGGLAAQGWEDGALRGAAQRRHLISPSFSSSRLAYAARTLVQRSLAYARL